MSQPSASARISKLAYIGWRGIEGCEVLELHPQFTGLVGPPGAGKSTLLMMLDYALIPDRGALDIRPLSNLRDASVAGSDTILGRIDPAYGYAYVVLDIMSGRGKRVVCGIQVHAQDGRAVFTGWHIRGSVPQVELDDLMAVADGESISYIALPSLKRNLAARGVDLHICRSIGEYGQVLYDAGVTPSPLTNMGDRRLYASLLAATFKGGLSDEVVAKLKDYLLPPPSSLREIVGGLQECANEVARTRSAIADAQRELALLRSTYGIGKEVIGSAVRSIEHDHEGTARELGELSRELAADRTAYDELATKCGALNDEIELAERLRKGALKHAQSESKAATDKHSELVGQLKQAESDVAAQQSQCESFKTGESAWSRVARGWNPGGGLTLQRWLDETQRRADANAFRSALDLEAIRTELDRLRQRRPSERTARVAAALQGKALEVVLAEDDEKTAMARALNLANLEEGVVGATADLLQRITPSEEFPDVFWMGAAAPEVAQCDQVGQWLTAPLAGGHVVMPEQALTRFGRTGIQNRIARLVLDEGRLARVANRHARQAAVRCGRRDLYLAKRDQVDFYAANRGQADAFFAALQAAIERQSTTSEELRACDRLVQELQTKLDDVEAPFEEQLSSLRRQLGGAQNQLTTLKSRLAEQEKRQVALVAQQHVLNRELGQAKEILGAEWAKFGGIALSATTEGKRLGLQARRLAELGNALGSEMGDRVPALAAANPEERVSVIRVWPELVAAVAEVIHSFTADTTHDDLIAKAMERRAALDEQLAQHENEMRLNARSLNLHITSNVRSQRSKVGKLSEFGRSIEFGNLMGVQVSLEPRAPMLEILSSFAQKAPQLSQYRSVEDALNRHFETAEPRFRFSGEQLLDYRNYLDLTIEVRRRDGAWTPADGLSGTEAIGGGLAVALMLTRAIAARGVAEGTGRNAAQLEPLYCIDELGRIDQTAHASLMEFAKRERFQLVVTAQSIESRLPCVQYALVRRFDPAERVVVRGLRVEAAESP